MAEELDSANVERKGMEKQITEEAMNKLKKDPKSADRMSHVLFDEAWHPGVIGIVASRIASATARPVFLLGRDGENLKGSGRSYGGLHLVEALRECAPHLTKFGGHQAAAGVSLQRDSLEPFRNEFERVVTKLLPQENCVRKIDLDAELTLQEINASLLNEIRLLEPFGQGNPEPLFCLRGISPRSGRVVGERHLKFTAEDGDKKVEAIAFGMGDDFKLEQLKSPLDVAFSLQENHYQGTTSLILHVRDLKPV